jgi:hypothetical protein
MTDEGIQQLFDTVHSHSFKVNGLVVAVLGACLVLFGFVFWHSEKRYEQLLGKAEEREAVYLKKLDDSEKRWEAAEQRIAELSAQQAQVQTRIVYRDKEADKVKAEVTAPDRSADKVSDDVLAAYKFPPLSLTGDNFTFSRPQVQAFVATKIDDDRFAADLADVQLQLGLEKQKNDALRVSLTEAQDNLKEAKGVIDGYKKVAKKGFFRRAGAAALKVGLFVGGIYLGRHL